MSNARSAGDVVRALIPVIVAGLMLHYGSPDPAPVGADPAPQQQPVFIPVVVPTVLNGPTPAPTPEPKPAPDPAPTPAPGPDPTPAPVPPPTPTPTPAAAGYTGRLVALYCLGPKPDMDLLALRRSRPVLDAFDADLSATWTSTDTPAGWTANQAVLDAATQAPCVVWIGAGGKVLAVTTSPTDVSVIEGLKKIRGGR